ncbi:MAG: septum site-determining protein MinC [Anaerolineae bacterium]|nr:MAG: septum site-determining protein MinC [Anaerolineae bacterium]
MLVTLRADNWEEAQAGLLERIQAQADFFRGADLSLDVGDQELRAAELGRLRDQVAELGVALRAVLSTSEFTRQTAETLGLMTYLPRTEPERSGQAFDTRVAGDEALLVRRTLRSGNSIQFPGHVVVIGDVNPGAEIIAGGHVLVWGRLRGTVHAGAEGDEEAVVCALELSPTQLRIADVVSVAPKMKGKPQPEMAHLVDGKVVAERWDARRPWAE